MNDLFPLVKRTLNHCAKWTLSLPECTAQLVEWAVPDNGRNRLQDRLVRLRGLPSSLERLLRLAFAGENNAGKSSLINAFVGSNIAATDALELTSAPMIFRYGPEPRATLIYKDTSEAVQIDNLEAILRDLRQDLAADLERVEVELPLDSLQSYELADVPGLGADQRRAGIARSFTEKVDAVLFILNAGLIGQSEMAQEIRSLALEFSEVGLVLNKLDQVGFANVDRLLEYVNRQNYGRAIPAYPMCVAGLGNEEISSPLPEQWLNHLKTDFIERVADNAQRVQAITGLSKAQRDLNVTSSLLQASYHQGFRAHQLVQKAIETLRQMESEVVSRIVNQVEGWLTREAFAEPTETLRGQFEKVGAPSRGALEAMVQEAFTNEVLDQESMRFSEVLQEIRGEAWRWLAARIEESTAQEHSAFQLESTLNQMRKVDAENGKKGSGGINDEIGMATFGIITAEESQRSGILTHEDIVESGALGLLVGGTITGVVAYYGSAVLMTTVTGIGLPVAAAVAVLWGAGKALDRSRNRPTESSSPELNRAAGDIRGLVCEKLKEAWFPNGIQQAVAFQIAQDRSDCEEALLKRLWPSDNRGEDLCVLEESIHALEELTQQVSGLRQELSGTEAPSADQPYHSPGGILASVLLNKPKHYGPDEADTFRKDLSSVLSAEDMQLIIMDRALTGHDLEWLRDCLPAQAFLRAFLYEAEKSTTARGELVRSLQRIRNQEKGEISARAVKYAGENRTPLDRTILFGSDWAIELSTALSEVGHRETVCALLDKDAEQAARTKYIEGLGSFSTLTDPSHCSQYQVLDL